MRNALRVGFAVLATAIFLSNLTPAPVEAASLPRKKCIKTFCKPQKKLCAQAFKGQFGLAKAECSGLGGAAKVCRKEQKAVFKENKQRCKQAFGTCKTCCGDPQTSSCSVAVLGDGICHGSAVGLEQCDGSDSAACPGACRGDCTCPSSTTTSTVTSTTAPATSTTVPPEQRCLEEIRGGNMAAAKPLCEQAAAGSPLGRLLAAAAGVVLDVLETPTLTDLLPRLGIQPGISPENISGLCGREWAVPEGIPAGAPRTGEILTALRDDAVGVLGPAMSALDQIPAGAVLHFNPANLPCSRLSGASDVEIDGGDLLLLRAVLNGVLAAAHLAAAYDADLDLADALNNRRSLPYLLDNNPELLTLVSCTDLHQARSRLDQALEAFILAVDLIEAETDEQSDDVIVIAPSDQDDADRARLVAGQLRAALSGVTTFSASEFTFLRSDQRLSLDPLFGCDLESLRVFLPPFDGGGNPDLCRLPDPTFGGLMPDLTRAELSRLTCSVCGDGIAGLDEHCDPGGGGMAPDDDRCPGRCIAAGQPGQCTCPPS